MKGNNKDGLENLIFIGKYGRRYDINGNRVLPDLPRSKKQRRIDAELDNLPPPTEVSTVG